ncbi:MAG: hypothetical protein HYU30_06940 [Chloroflexi bacterium]|nr:hypothetical protein [Chloroflexota bacterium]
MNKNAERDTLLSNLDAAVKSTLAYFDGPGASTKARVGDWGAWEVLSHFLYWHETTAQGMEWVARGFGPCVVTTETDATNAVSVQSHKGESLADLARHARQLQARLDTAARRLSDIDAVVMVRPGGVTMTARQRLERLAGHWQGHVAALQGASR